MGALDRRVRKIEEAAGVDVQDVIVSSVVTLGLPEAEAIAALEAEDLRVAAAAAAGKRVAVTVRIGPHIGDWRERLAARRAGGEG